jgi:hypothetical protein
MKEKILQLRREGKSYKQIVKILGCSQGTVSFHCKKEGLGQEFSAKRDSSKGIKKPTKKRNRKGAIFNPTGYICSHCDKEFIGHFCKPRQFCSIQCQAEKKKKEKLENWLSGNDKGWCGKTISLKKFIRRYMFEKFDGKCCKCGWGIVHELTGVAPLEVNHIDGDPKNCKEENLELICPNCHALTHNYRALNKNSPRNRKALVG